MLNMELEIALELKYKAQRGKGIRVDTRESRLSMYLSSALSMASTS